MERLEDGQFDFLFKFYQEDGYDKNEIIEMIQESYIIQEECYLVLIWNNGASDVFKKDFGKLIYQRKGE